MRTLSIRLLPLSVLLLLAATAFALQKPKVITFGKPYSVKLFIGPDEDNTVPMKIRSLSVDGRIREFTTGESHEITDRIFAVRRAYRLNNSLPEDESKVPDWIWQRGGWLMVDRLNGRVSQLKLVNFDSFYSEASWFRDYVAYCGVSDAGDKLYAVVVQWGARKPLLMKELGTVPEKSETPESYCEAPVWERKPTRVIFRPRQSEKFSYTVFSHSVDAQPGSTDEE